MALAILMYAQDNDEQLPGANWTQAIAVTDSGIFKCPDSARGGTTAQPGYVMNLMTADQVLGQLPGDPTQLWLTADGAGGIGCVSKVGAMRAKPSPPISWPCYLRAAHAVRQLFRR